MGSNLAFELDEYESIDLELVEKSLIVPSNTLPLHIVSSRDVTGARTALCMIVPIVTAITSLLNFGINRNLSATQAISQVIAICNYHIEIHKSELCQFKSRDLPTDVYGVVDDFLNNLDKSLLVARLITRSAHREHLLEDYVQAANQWCTTCSQLHRALKALLGLEKQYLAEWTTGIPLQFDFEPNLVEAAVGGWPSANEKGELIISTFVEKRASPRVLVDLNCTLKADDNSKTATIVDISDSGFGLITTLHVSKGMQVEVFPPNGLPARCNVAWTDKRRCGLHVVENNFEMRNFLRSFFKKAGR